MSTTAITFDGSTGAPLSGVLHRPQEGHRAAVLLTHCFTCSKDLHTMTRLARGLEAAGYAVLRFDFTGLGDRDGALEPTTVAYSVGDVIAATEELRRAAPGPTGVFGHSMGGAAALLAAPELPEVTSLVTLGAPSSPAHLATLLPLTSPRDDDGRVSVRIGGRDVVLGPAFLADLEAHDQAAAVAALDRPLLVIHAPDDRVVAISEGERIFAAARQPKAFHPLIGADHLVSDRRDAQRLLALVQGWFDATL